MSRSLVTPLRTHRREVVKHMAPRYRQASFAQKSLLLDRVVEATGYARKYVIGLLNHASEKTQTIPSTYLSHSSPEVQNALLQAWKVANWICAKRLIPFLPTLIDALERHGHLHLAEESRNHLLQMSPATAERVLHAQRQPVRRGLSTTKAGPLLKHQIPLRTFEQWDEARPGFLEADLVAHCGGQSEGNPLYTFTLTDIATGWTECLPLLYRSPEAVQIALMRARTLFPFPILGIDTDNGKEFLNETILAYCEREHLTFTRGRPECKNDQCFIEQKNGAVVRQFVGYDRFVGEQAYRQLGEVYRALRLYVNCFQPSMKLQSKDRDGERVRRVYDPAKTPLQRLVLSGILSEEKQRELSEVFHMLDPLDLFQQVEQLHQAFLHHAVTLFSSPLRTPAPALLQFSSDQCFKGSLHTHTQETATPPSSAFDSLWQERLHLSNVLDWPRTTRDPFEGEWGQILSCVLAHPEYSSGDIFKILQQQAPERYHSSQLGTLQRGIRKIRAHLLYIMEEPWSPEVIQAGSFGPTESKPGQQECEADSLINVLCSSSAGSLQEHVDEGSVPYHSSAEEVIATSTTSVPTRDADQPREKGCQVSFEEHGFCSSSLSQGSHSVHLPPMTIKQAIASYLQEQMQRGRRPKTLEWHQAALRVFQHYLVIERHLGLLSQITTSEIHGWFAFLRTPSLVTGISRRASTIATYGRSARAFCHWAVQKGYLERTPMTRGILPKAEKKRIDLIEPEVFDRLLLACQPKGESGASLDRVAARNRSILWVLMDTGMRVSDLCGLHLSDVNREQRSLRVQGRGNERWLALSPSGWFQLLSYLEYHRPKKGFSEGEQSTETLLFLSETYHPLTINALTLLFGRLRKRAGMTEEQVTPSLLRETFAVRYLQAGGEPEALRAILGLTGMESVKRYEQISTQKIEDEPQKEPAEPHRSQAMAAPQKSTHRRRKPSSAATRSQQQEADRTHRAGKKKSLADAGEDP